MVFTDNVTLSDNIYIFNNSNGLIKLQQYPTISSSLSFNSFNQYNQNNAVKVIYGETSNNITLSYSNYQSNSSLHIGLNNSNIFNTSNIPYISYSNSYNNFKLNIYDDIINLIINNSNLLNISSYSNDIPKLYNSDADIVFYGSSNLQIKDISYLPNGIMYNPIIFKQPIKVPFITSCNLSIFSNDLYTTSNYAYTTQATTITNAQTTADWASNNLLNKSGGTMTGILNVQASNINVSPTTDINEGIRVIGNGQDGATPDNYNGGLGSWYGIGFKCVLDNTTRFLHDTRTGNTYIEGNLGIGKSNPAYKLDVNGTVNATAYTGTTITSLSNLGVFSSNVVVSTSNTSYSLSNIVYGTTTSNITNVQTTADWSSNVGLFGSNVAVQNSNALYTLSNEVFDNITNLTLYSVFNSNTGVYGSNTIYTLSNEVFDSITNLISYSVFNSNTGVFGSNTAAWNSNITLQNSNTLFTLSNEVFTTITNNLSSLSNYSYSNVINQSNVNSSLSNSIASVNSSLTSYSNFDSTRYNTLSNYTYNIESSNSVVQNFYTKNIQASDGGTIGSLLMSATGLSLSSYNLFANNGRLTGVIQDTLGKLKIDPSGSIEFQALLGKVGQYTDSVQIGVSTIELSNNTIYFKDGNTSNSMVSSNAITVLNSNINTFTISNANVYTNCNVYGSNITSLSNLALWSSNNLVSKAGGTIIGTLSNVGVLNVQGTSSPGGGYYSSATFTNPSGGYGGLLIDHTSSYGNINFVNASDDPLKVLTAGIPAFVVSKYSGFVGVNTSNPSTTLDVNGTVNASVYTGTTITSLSNLGLFGSNTSISASNTAFNLSNNVYTTISNDITTSQNTANFGSNTSVSACNFVISLSNAFYTSSTNATAISASNTAYWSSNNLLNKAGGTMTGVLNVQASNINVSPSADTNQGISLIGNGQDGATPDNYNGGLASWNGIGFKCVLDSQTRFLHDTRTGNTYIAGNLGIGTSNPTTKLDVVGTVNATTYTGNTITSLSNLGLFGSNTAVSACNSVVSLSNAFYTSTTGTTAIGASNTAYWSSNNLLNKNTGGTITANITVSSNINIGSNVFVANDILSTNTTTTYNTGSYLYNQVFDIAYSNVSPNVDGSKYATAGSISIKGQTLQWGGGAINVYGAELFLEGGKSPNAGLQAGNMVFKTNNTEQMRINESGNVGIGTTSPSTRLDVAGTINATSYTGVTITSLSNLGIFSSNTALWSSNNLLQKSGGTIVGDLIVNSNVGIGTSNPLFNLDVVGSCKLSSSVLGDVGFGDNYAGFAHKSFFGQSGNYSLLQENTGQTFMNCKSGTAIRFRESNVDKMILVGGKLGIGTITPSTTLDVNGGVTSSSISNSGIISTSGLSSSTITNSGSLSSGSITNTGVLSTGSLTVGGGATISSITSFIATVGSSSSQKVQYTMSGSFPSGTYDVYITPLTNATNDDVFATTVMSKSSSEVKVSIYRVDGGSWSLNLQLHVLIVGR